MEKLEELMLKLISLSMPFLFLLLLFTQIHCLLNHCLGGE